MSKSGMLLLSCLSMAGMSFGFDTNREESARRASQLNPIGHWQITYQLSLDIILGGLYDTLDMVYSKPCLLDEQCLKVSYCDRSAGLLDKFGVPIDGECRPKAWVWIILAAVVILLMVIFICICYVYLLFMVKCIFRFVTKSTKYSIFSKMKLIISFLHFIFLQVI